jgi:chromosome segregation ATPase
MLYSIGVKGEMQMSTKLPPLSARVTALERSQIMLNARIEEIAEDVADSFAAQAPYQTRIEEKIDALTEEVSTIKATMATKEDVDARFDAVDARFYKIEADITAMESRILGAFQQLVTIIDIRLPPQGK